MLSPAEEVKSRLDIVEVIQGYIRLHKAGVNFKAPCPFHHEKTPSFFVSPARQIWHCFGCGKGGDMFKFVMEIEGLDFLEALQLLAGRAGVTLRREDPSIHSERQRLYEANEAAAKLFEKTLMRTPAVLEYLKKRGVRDETMRNFRIGFAPERWNFVLKNLENTFSRDHLEKAGLIVKSEDGASFYDRFRGRIMFPITDGNGRVIGFGGRIFEETKDKRPEIRNDISAPRVANDHVAKYVNTPATMIYDKSRVLYGFDKAKQEIRAKNQVVVVEGYMDCVMSHQAGVKNTIAVSGTALTPQQLGTLKRLCGTIICSFDADAAGESATRRSLTLAAEFEFERRIAVIHSGKDPADMVLENPALWQAAVENAKSVVAFYFDKALSTHSQMTLEGKKAIAAMVLPYIGELRDEIEKAHWVGEMSRRLAIPEEAIWKEVQRKLGARTDTEMFRRGVPGDSERAPAYQEAQPSRRLRLEERLLALLAAVSEAERQAFVAAHNPIFSETNHALYTALIGAAHPAPTHAFSQTFNILKFKGDMLLENLGDAISKEIALVAHELEKERLKEELVRLGESIKAAEREGGEEAVAPLLESFRNLSRQLKNIA